MIAAVSALWVVPLLAALLCSRIASARRARVVAVLGASLALALSVAIFVSGEQGDAFARVDVTRGAVLGLRYHVGVDGLSAVLLPLTASLALAALAAVRRAGFDGRMAARVLVTEAGLLGCLVSLDLGLLTLFWALSLAPLRSAARAGKDRALAGAVDIAVVGSVLPLVVAAVALGVEGARAGLHAPLDLTELGALAAARPFAPWIGVLVLIAALVRMGVFPVHSWVPFAVERGPMPLVLVGIVTPIGSYLVARVALPLFPAELGAPTLLPVGVVTAAYGALLAVGQHDLRRLLGFVLVSQAGLVLAGLANLNEPSVAGSLLQAMAAVVACSGLLLVASAVEARAGTVDMRRLGGLVRRAPHMASVFLLLSLAAVGFPATVTFVSEDLLVQGLLRGHGLLAGTLLVVTAVNGVTLVRAFKRTFLGPPSPHADDLGAFEEMLPRERWVSMTIVVALLAGGFAPAPLLAVRQGVLGVMPRAAPARAGPRRRDGRTASPRLAMARRRS